MERTLITAFVHFYSALRFTVFFIENEYIRGQPRNEQTLFGVVRDISIVLMTAVVSSAVLNLFWRRLDRHPRP